MRKTCTRFIKSIVSKSFLNLLISMLLIVSLVDNSMAQSGSALDFDGVDNYVTIPHNSLLKPASAITIEAWINPANIHSNTYSEIYRKEDGNSRHLLSFQNNGTILSFGLGVGGIYSEYDVNISPSDFEGQWVHVAATFDGSLKKIYRNGIQLGSQNIVGAIDVTGTAPAIIGSLSGGDEFFKGGIDEFRLWNKALTGPEIQRDMNCELAGPQSGLIIYYKFNQGIASGSNSAVSTLIDYSSNSINGTLMRFDLTGPNSNWIAPGAVENGTNCVLPQYTFTGNGNWDDSLNWADNKIPPVKLPVGTTIIVNPNSNGIAILNRPQFIAHNATITVQPNKKLIIPGDYLNYNSPVADFSFVINNSIQLPATVSFMSVGEGMNLSYTWFFGDGDSSTAQNPGHSFSSGGIYNVKLIVANAIGRDSVTRQIRISPYSQTYTTFGGVATNLYAWEGNKYMLLSRNNNQQSNIMSLWLHAIDGAYTFYKTCTGSDPIFSAPTYINNHCTIADVASTCGSGCGYLGFSGIELQNSIFDNYYSVLSSTGTYDHICFYEMGRNFWFFGNKLNYKEAGSFPVAGAYAVFMGTIEARDAIGVPGNTVNGQTYNQIKDMFASYLDFYLADTSLNWSNTLAIDQGVPGHCNAADLFVSMCMKLKRDFGGDYFVQNIWKNVALRLDAVTTQDAVDNFFLASCKTANRNLTSLFQSWRWPLSATAVAEASQYPA